MYEYKVVSIDKVVDGDTVDCTIDLGFSTFTKQRVRLAGIDAPELRSSDPMVKQAGVKASSFLHSWMKNNSGNIIVATTKDDKYGRMLGKFYCKGSCVNDVLVELGYAWPYNGEGKNADLELLKKVRREKGLD
jgi:micrococcal nuclease